MMRTPAHPGLYDVASAPPVLLGTRCGVCGTAFFPPLHIGCEICGAADSELGPAALAARGQLHSFVTVHMHRGTGIEAPFTVAEIVLDDGPVVRGTMTSLTGDGLIVGQTVAADWFVSKVDDEGNEVVEPRFGPAESGS